MNVSSASEYLSAVVAGVVSRTTALSMSDIDMGLKGIIGNYCSDEMEPESFWSSLPPPIVVAEEIVRGY